MNDITKTLEERGNTHGAFTGNSFTAQELKMVMRMSPNWAKMPPYMREALEMDAHKIGRILHGDFTFVDHWVDKEGYAALVVRELKK